MSRFAAGVLTGVCFIGMGWAFASLQADGPPPKPPVWNVYPLPKVHPPEQNGPPHERLPHLQGPARHGGEEITRRQIEALRMAAANLEQAGRSEMARDLLREHERLMIEWDRQQREPRPQPAGGPAPHEQILEEVRALRRELEMLRREVRELHGQRERMAPPREMSLAPREERRPDEQGRREPERRDVPQERPESVDPLDRVLDQLNFPEVDAHQTNNDGEKK